ncbi:MAG: ZIP family metal transporter [Gemmatimonadaceae bacterium]|nr:ZIP family metal transporter [Gemmatimonadaceae bacterium]
MRPEYVFGAAAAAANVLGAVAVTSRRARWSVRALDSMTAIAAGFMMAVATIEILPEAILRGGRDAAVVALVGYVLVYLTQHALTRHFHFGEETHHVTTAVSTSALIGLMLHTVVDGVAIASGFGVNDSVGTLVFVAVLLHKFPEGLAISSLFLAAGASRGRALLAAAALGAATIIGVVATDGVPAIGHYGLALSAGVTLYVAASNLVPEFQSKRDWRLPLSFFVGCALFFAARSLAR